MDTIDIGDWIYTTSFSEAAMAAGACHVPTPST